MKVLFNALPFQRGTDPATVIMAYVESLRGVALDAIKAGISKFLRGECENVNPRYVPTPPELARIIRTTVIPSRIPAERQIAPFRYASEGERARMKLKMPMFSHAFPNETMMAELAQANAAGMEAMIVLAVKWGVPVPDGLNEQTDAHWHRARNQALAEIERNPPTFMRQMRSHDDFEAAA